MSLIEVISHGAVTELKLARAPVNALNLDLCRAITASIGEAVAAGAQGIVFTSAHKVFSAGLDVPYLLSLGDDQNALLTAWSAFFDAARALAGAPVPVVAAINGHAPAGGCVLALACDYRVMASGPFKIGLNETQVGLVAPEGVQRQLRRLVGPYRAERMLIAGELVDAEQALQLGMVDELVEIENVANRARIWLEQLLTLPREAMLHTRQLARADLIEALAPHNINLELFVKAWFVPSTQAALRALVAKLGK